MPEQSEIDAKPIVRRDRYTVVVDGSAVRADHAVERRIRALDAEARARFLVVMGHVKRPADEGGGDRG